MISYRTIESKPRYLDIADEGATLDMEKKQPEPKYGMTAECPVCKGFGGWHLRLNAYGKGKHFDCFCSNCMGWGHVSPKEADHAHEFAGMEEEKANEFRAVKGLDPVRYTRGNCCHNSICKICGQYRFIDSSD